MDGECQLHKSTENKFKRTGESASRRVGEELVLGQVDFINCLPINLPIELGEVKINANIVKGIPSKLNKLILNNEIDIAPISSLTYLENKDKLMPIADLCIASNGPADSVLLFSKFPLEELNGAKIALSPASATSNKLLEVILNEFLNLECRFESSLKNETAQLLIGDDALKEYAKGPQDKFIYDLGSLWKKHTGLPMIFGIWVCRKEIAVGAGLDLPLIAQYLNQSKEIGLNEIFDVVLKKAMDSIPLSRDFYRGYFEHLSYNFTNDFKQGLDLFEKHCNASLRGGSKRADAAIY